MSKWKWIAQDEDGEIYKFGVEPTSNDCAFVSGGIWKLVKIGKQNPNFRETLINLETEDYKIKNWILTRIPRKTKLDKLIDNVKKIDKKAAKWMNKNRHKLEDVDDLSYCFGWSSCNKYDWYYIHNELIKLETEPAK